MSIYTVYCCIVRIISRFIYPRILQTALLEHSFFLFGLRQVGKTTLLKAIDQTLHLDFLVDLALREHAVRYPRPGNPPLR